MATDGERLIKVETQMDNIEKKVDKGFEDGARQHAELKKMFVDFTEKSEQRFASKWVEKAVYSAVGLICVAVITALLSQVILK